MVTNRIKTQIRDQEVYREEVRREIRSRTSHSQGSRLWQLINSSFALWFLSSVVLAGITTIYSNSQKAHEEYLLKSEMLRRLHTEIQSRVSEGLVASRLDLRRIDEGKKYYDGAIYGEALNYLNNKVSADRMLFDVSIYPELKERSFRSLVFEMESVCERSSQASLAAAKEDYTALSDLSDQSSVKDDISKSLPNKEHTRKVILRVIEILERLKNLSCTSE